MLLQAKHRPLYIFSMHQKFNRSPPMIHHRETHKTNQAKRCFLVLYFFSYTRIVLNNNFSHFSDVYLSCVSYLNVCTFDQHHYKHDVEQTMQWTEYMCVFGSVYNKYWSELKFINIVPSENEINVPVLVGVCLYILSKQTTTFALVCRKVKKRSKERVG